MAAFSLYVAHIISTIEGGIVTTNDPAFAEILRSLRSHGRACKCESCVLNLNSGYCAKRFNYDSDVRFVFERIGFSAKMNEIEAAIGIGYLEVYPEIFKKRMDNFNYLREKFTRFQKHLFTINPSAGEELAPYCFPLILNEGVSFKRDELVTYLECNGIDTRSLFLSMPTQCKGFEFLGYKLGQFPEAEYIGKNGLHIGIHQDIRREQMDYFIELLEKFLKNK